MHLLVGPAGVLLLGTLISGLVGALAAALLLLARNRHLIDMLRHDLTAQREARRRLTESVRLLQRAENVSRVGGFMIDIASGEQQWTAQTYRIHDVDDGVSPTQKLVEAFLLPEVRERLREATRTAQETGMGYDLEMPIVTAKNRAIWIRMAAEVESDNGVPVRIVGAIQDITDRCKLEQRLRDALTVAGKASQSKSEFLANMSHEIRTPLNAVIGLGYLLEQTALSDEQRQFLTKIQFAGRALLGVINNVLDLSKIEADEMSLEDEPFDLLELVQDVSQMLLPQAVEKGVELIVESAASLPRMVMGDASRVRQILTNLMHNSIKFTECGHVNLAVFCTEHGAGRVRLRCEVKDTGIGIEPAACARLFTPFTQADASTTRRFGGTGLGLSIARRFVELMGGEIGVISTVSVGSTFWIEIPLRVAPEVDGSLTNALRILIVDPNGDTPQGLGAMVRALGWNPQVVETGEQMIAIMTGSPALARPDALILDLHLRDTDAHEWVARLAKAWIPGDLPSVIVVAESSESYMEHKQLMRATDVLLVRPVSSSALFNAINLAVSRQPDSYDRVFESTNFDELHAQWLSGVRVLVVDDSDINLEVAQRILENQGAKVMTCSDGSSAIARLRSFHQEIDVVLMDVQMPVLDGNEATRRIRTELKLQLPIVALTAGALVGERQRALDAGMDDFVSKPFDPQALIRKVRRLVEHARGEPIPMVFDDKKSAGHGDGRPFMKSIDAGVVQQMFGDDLSLFKSLLARMLRDYSDFALPIEVALDDDLACRQLKARSHKLKGSAGMIGATNVMRFAGAAERALQDSRPADVVEGILKKLAAALTTLREEATLVLETESSQDAARDAHAEIAPHIDCAEIDELCALLEAQNLAAVDKFAVLSPALREMLDMASFDGLQDAVENLEFQLGAELLREIPRERRSTAA
jgi:signal transduction histidine kinase/DNA-binding response OmpR family regulator